ncbi:TatD family hydrolase [Roseateles sp. BYS180W]|uniref:TatD family hydrolase n=1 Tax=Roseateles rivi TaxID=3299028 RepID=A0ABW7FXN7_9BURK
MWIDTHCHLDATEFDTDREAVLLRARSAGVVQLVLPGVSSAQMEPMRDMAQRWGLAYALGIHPLYVQGEGEAALEQLAQALARWRDDPLLVAVGEIGLDYFVPGLDVHKQQVFLQAQLRLAAQHGLPVLLHSRRSVDHVLAALRRTPVVGGLAHAFNGSLQQAQHFISLGFKLGMGGALTFERALQIRRLASQLPVEALVLETDAPDMPPHWLYKTAAQRRAGEHSRNEPAQLPRIAAELAQLRGAACDAAFAAQLKTNSLQALPRLAGLLPRA